MYRVSSIIGIVAGAGAALCGVAGFAASAAAQGVCVVCSEPQAVYNCQPEQGMSLKAGDPRLNLLCITELARAGNHGSCSARRQVTGNCEGQTRTVAIGPVAPVGPKPPADVAASAMPPAESGQRDAKAPPETVEEFAKETAQQSKDQLVKATNKVGDAAKKTGEAVGDAAKKSWDCLSSFFKKC